jgi:FixJ family two-component response regulator
MRVLVVDADAASAHAYGAVLQRRGVTQTWMPTLRGARDVLDDTARRHEAIVVDLALPDGSGLDLVRRVRARDDTLPVLLTLCREEHGLANVAQRYGAEVVFKPCESDNLRSFIERVRSTRGGFEIAVERRLTEVCACGALTSRERDVLASAVRGGDRSRIAEDLGIAPGTVKTHVRSVLAKTRAPSLLELVCGILRGALEERCRP